MASWGVIDSPVRPGRVAFDPAEFYAMIEQQGNLLAWSRASDCPCSRFNPQTRQPNPICPRCNGLGIFYFNPPSYDLDEALVNVPNGLTDVQRVIAEDSAVLIRGIVYDSTYEAYTMDKIGNWAIGQAMISVRGENLLGFRDKLVNLDQIITFSEVVTTGAAGAITTRYPIVEINTVQSLTATYTDADYELNDGALAWKAGRAPAAGVRLAVHYTCHPVWIVMEHPHVARASNLGAPGSVQQTVQALARLEFLPET